MHKEHTDSTFNAQLFKPDCQFSTMPKCQTTSTHFPHETLHTQLRKTDKWTATKLS